LDYVLNQIKKVKEINKIILVNDGSTDNSLEIVKEKHNNLEIVSYEKNK
jgi:glycosyltransferase involved in cell wall biosynthesis